MCDLSVNYPPIVGAKIKVMNLNKGGEEERCNVEYSHTTIHATGFVKSLQGSLRMRFS